MVSSSRSEGSNPKGKIPQKSEGLHFINYDSLVEQKIYKQGHKLMPQHPFRFLVCGSSASGKTNMILNLLLNGFLYYDKLYLYSKSLEQPKYQYLIRKIEEVCDRNGIPVEDKLEYGEDISDIARLDTLNEKIQNIVLFDDLLTEKNQEIINTYFVKSRHQNCSLIYLTQSYFPTEKLIRHNSTHYALYKTNNRNLDLITQDLAGSIDVAVFKKLFKIITDEPFKFVFLDPLNQNEKMRFRNSFELLSQGTA